MPAWRGAPSPPGPGARLQCCERCGGWCGEWLWYSSFCLHQLKRALALNPVAGRILHQLLEADLGLVDRGDHAEVLTQVIALLHAVEVRACPHQRESLFGLG